MESAPWHGHVAGGKNLVPKKFGRTKSVTQIFRRKKKSRFSFPKNEKFRRRFSTDSHFSVKLGKFSESSILATKVSFSRLVIILAYAPTGFAEPCFVLDGFVRKPLSTGWIVLDKSWECRESNPGLLNEKPKHYLCTMPPPWETF